MCNTLSDWPWEKVNKKEKKNQSFKPNNGKMSSNYQGS